jgi:hypothetical protein
MWARRWRTDLGGFPDGEGRPSKVSFNLAMDKHGTGHLVWMLLGSQCVSSHDFQA